MRPEDFEVEELPAYELSGEGEHLYLFVEKRGCETLEVARALSRICGVSLREVGYAGLKDRQAVARQWFSLPVKELPAFPEAALPGARVLARGRHGHKLRSGVLKGNRFQIRLRGASEASGARAILARLGERGVPNWFGPQRFGRRGDNAVVGAALIGIGTHPLLQKVAHDPFLRKLTLSALQSELFNRLLAARVEARQLGEVEAGDVLQPSDDPRATTIDDPGPWRPRVQIFESAVTGPMFGPRMTLPRERPAEREAAVLAEAGIPRLAFAHGGKELRGTRRAYRFKLEAPEVIVEPGALLLKFALPSGAYATSILRELTRTPEGVAAESATGAEGAGEAAGAG